jgi:DNA-binding HxlR family transcriptional regulator
VVTIDVMTAPEALQWSVDNCTIQRSLEVMGDRWSLIVLREVLQGIRRFDDMTVRTAIPRQVLAARLRRLVQDGILRKVPYREPGQRERHEYRLTDKGLDLYPVLIALQEWGNRYLADPAGPPTEFAHRDCGEPVHLVVRCAAGHDLAGSRQVVGRIGPGAVRRSVAEVG